jgi:hypothetical protein
MVRKEIDRMVAEQLLCFDSTLFTRAESSYFNYFLNKKEFTNGLDLRNQYMHGTNPGPDTKHERDYYILLRLIILVLLKMEDDLIVREISG